MGPGAPTICSSEPAPRRSLSNVFEVSGVDAGGNAAQVIHFESIRDGAGMIQESPNVSLNAGGLLMRGHDVGRIEEEAAVTVLIFPTHPDPATVRGDFDLAPKSKVNRYLEFEMDHMEG